MRLATVRGHDGGTRAVRVDDELLVDLGVGDLGEFLSSLGWPERAAAASQSLGAGATALSRL